MDTIRLQELFHRYYHKTASPAERKELMELIQQASPAVVEELIKTAAENLSVTDYQLEPAVVESILQRILQPAPVRRINPITIGWYKRTVSARWRIAVAASILIAISTVAYFVIPAKEASQTKPTAKTIDIKPPETNRAMITLTNGERIYLDSVNNGTLITQNNVKLIKTADGKIVYEGSSSPSPAELVPSKWEEGRGEASLNTLTNPKGSKVIDMTLADGSHVWLNAGSSVTYPVAFIGNERKVNITGEVYFEITHDKSRPFSVSTIPPSGGGGATVQVLGTHFNVNAYDDESDIKVTLLEGSVKTSNKIGSITLKPGQQARLTSNQQPVTSNPDLEQVMAWKNGRFELNGNTIEPIMRQVARWYNVEVEYSGPKPVANFMGGTSRQDNLSELLKILEQTKAVKFKIENKKIIVTN